MCPGFWPPQAYFWGGSMDRHRNGSWLSLLMCDTTSHQRPAAEKFAACPAQPSLTGFLVPISEPAQHCTALETKPGALPPTAPKTLASLSRSASLQILPGLLDFPVACCSCFICGTWGSPSNSAEHETCICMCRGCIWQCEGWWAGWEWFPSIQFSRSMINNFYGFYCFYF